MAYSNAMSKHHKKRRHHKKWKNVDRIDKPARKVVHAAHKVRRVKRRGFFRTLFKWGIYAGIFGGIIAAISIFAISLSLPDPDKLTDRVVEQSTKIFDKTGEHLLYEIFANQKRTLIELEDLPEYAVQATIAIEDKHFYEHKGVRWISIARALFNNAIGRRTGSGGASTLTQQLVKNAIVGDERSYLRKLKEAILAQQIEKTFNKQQILKLYFNEIPYGSSNYGIQAASQAYFGVDASDITVAQAATLAALPKAPTRYLNDFDALKIRRDFVLDLMAQQGFIDGTSAAVAQQEPVEIREKLEGIQAPHFVLYVKEQLTELFGEKLIETGGLSVRTSLDFDIQEIAQEEIEKGCEHNAAFNQASNASMVAINPRTGEIVAMVGSCDYFNDEIDGQVNVALRPRQPGSSLKPLVYMTGFEKGFTPSTILYDAFTNFASSGKPYAPNNYNGEELGPVTTRKALQGSLNIPAVKMLYLAGVRDVLENAAKMGYQTLTDPDRYGLSLVLGGAEVKLLEHVTGYATLASEGKFHDPISILEVRDDQGVLFEQKPDKGKQVLDKDLTALITSVISDDNARAYAFGAGGVLSLRDRPVAAKTGTTNDYRDGWTLGYTPSLAAGVWVGNNDNTPMRRGVGGSVGAGPIWNGFMRRALEGKSVESFPKPPKQKAKKPVLNGTAEGGVPVRIDRVSGKLATEHTPEELIDEVLFLQPHSILHYVNKNDPDGAVPSNPGSDPQYSAWEEGVKVWIEKQAAAAEEEGRELQFKLGEPPTEEDDIHDTALRPTLSVSAPAAGAVLKERVIETDIAVSAPRGVAKVLYLLDDQLIGKSEGYPFSIYYENDELTNGEHILKVKAYDDVSNITIVEVPITIDALPTPPKLSWTSPRRNSTLFSTLFPLELQMRLSQADLVSHVQLYVLKPGETQPVIIGDAQMDGDLAKLMWNEIPSEGSYTITPRIYLKSGGSVGGQVSIITVR